MYRTLLSALLLGLFPSTNGFSTDIVALQRVAVAPPGVQLLIADTLSAEGVAIYDMESGQKIFGKDARTQRPMASLTKLMTALLIVENHDLDTVVTIPRSVVDVSGNKAYLAPGAHFTIADLLSALLINSANDAALTLAELHSGSVSAFATQMNERALQLGMTGTSFRNPAGLDHPAHWSTPQDIAWLTIFALRYPEIASRMSAAGRQIASLEGDVLHLYHTHALLHESGPVIAGKTGTTHDAGQCLVSVIELQGKKYVVILLHSNERYKDMSTIISAMDTGPEPVAAR